MARQLGGPRGRGTAPRGGRGERAAHPLSAVGLRFGIVVSRFHEPLTTRLLDAALATLLRHGVLRAAVTVVWVPGAFELPLAAQRVAASGRCDAVIALGLILRGETTQSEHLAGSVLQGLSRVALDTGVPTACGVVTAGTGAQARARAGRTSLNRGREAALAAIEMVRVLRTVPPRLAQVGNATAHVGARMRVENPLSAGHHQG